MRRFIDLIDRNITEGVGLRDAAQLVEFKRGDDGAFETQYYEESTIQELAAGHSFVFIIKGLDDYQGPSLVEESVVVQTGSGETALYTFQPDFNTIELGDYLVDGTVGERVADAPARLAITGQSNGYIVGQTDTGQYWTLTDDANISNADSWELSTMKPYADALLEIVWTDSAGKELSTNTVTARIHSDLYRKNESVPSSASPGFYNKTESDARYLQEGSNLSDLNNAATARNNLGLGNVDNTSDADKPVSTATQTALDAKLDDSQKGAADGLAELDSGGKVPVAQLPDSVVGQIEFQSTWNASTNTPAIPAAASGNKGHYYVVSVAGSTSIDGEDDWEPGDWLVSNGSSWDKIDNTEAIKRKTLFGLLEETTAGNITANPSRKNYFHQIIPTADINYDLADIGTSAGEADVGWDQEIVHTGTSAFKITGRINASTEIFQLNAGERIYIRAMAEPDSYLLAKQGSDGSPILIKYINLDAGNGSNGDTVTLYSPFGSQELWIQNAIAIHRNSGTITSAGQIALRAGATKVTADLSLGTSPADGDKLDFSISANSKLCTAANALLVEKVAIADDTHEIDLWIQAAPISG